MKKEGLILIMEPERIIGLELQVLLEGNGYNVSQCNTPNLADCLSKAQTVNIIIMNIDKATEDDFTYLKNNFPLTQICMIGISSSKQIKKEREGVKFTQTFLKPFESKSILSFINNLYAVSEYN
ncbi:MAG TPA: hypothetical protein VKG26_04210 [Bacteroidia bacterium]|nr:hypothetical protein [Bacteroidia bacterium]